MQRMHRAHCLPPTWQFSSRIRTMTDWVPSYLVFSGYKLWVFWSELDQDKCANFMEEGMDFLGSNARYVILGPDDRYIQTQAVSQVVHAVPNIGYCAANKCIDNCVNWNPSKRNGLIAVDGMHYWHADFMAASARAVTDELKSYCITNQDLHHDLVECFKHIEKLRKQTKERPT